MGKGDIKTGKGKRTNGSYGNTRKRKVAKNTVTVAPKTEKAEKAPAAKKPAAAKKTVAPKAEKTVKAPAAKKTTKKETEE